MVLGAALLGFVAGLRVRMGDRHTSVNVTPISIGGDLIVMLPPEPAAPHPAVEGEDCPCCEGSSAEVADASGNPAS